MPKITYDYGNARQKCLCNIKIHFKYLDADWKYNKARAHRDGVYNIVTKIFLQVIPLCLEYKEFMTNICMCNIYNSGETYDDHVMNLIGK